MPMTTSQLAKLLTHGKPSGSSQSCKTPWLTLGKPHFACVLAHWSVLNMHQGIAEFTLCIMAYKSWSTIEFMIESSGLATDASLHCKPCCWIFPLQGPLQRLSFKLQHYNRKGITLLRIVTSHLHTSSACPQTIDKQHWVHSVVGVFQGGSFEATALQEEQGDDGAASPMEPEEHKAYVKLPSGAHPPQVPARSEHNYDLLTHNNSMLEHICSPSLHTNMEP